ncbi:MAG: glutamate mutase L, partial [Eubacteriales bacterium]|nr:glutamate mutase L [Eubacteriales bacterium]
TVPVHTLVPGTKVCTSVQTGDVRLGLDQAKASLAKKLNVETLSARQSFATSSAAGGLSMTVHGLVRDMTVRAAREAALGSGAVMRLVTAGKLRRSDLEEIAKIDPRIIMVAGGVDFGERDTAIYNFTKLAERIRNTPFLYAGNCENQHEIQQLAQEYGVELYLSENVYPEIDRLNIEPARAIIQKIFEKHIIEAPGMAHIHEQVSGKIMPTPGAVMAMAELLYEEVGDLLVIDVGGATTDVHSVTHGSEAMQKISLAPEPFAKRTVEGDLGVFINRHLVFSEMTENLRRKQSQAALEALDSLAEQPQSEADWQLLEALTETCLVLALDRHAGRIFESYTSQGRNKMVKGKDLTQVSTIILTGGALTHLEHPEDLLRRVLAAAPADKLYPAADARVIIDHNYIMASLGVMASRYPAEALKIFLNSAEIKFGSQ